VRHVIGLLPLPHGLLLFVYLVTSRFVTTDVPSGVPSGVPDRAWWLLYGLVSLLNEFTPFFFLPLPLWLLTAAITRTASGAVAAAVPWLIFAWLYGELFLPRFAGAGGQPRGAAEAGPAVRVMTFNLLATGRAAADRAAPIRAADPDVLLVQELSASLAQALDAALSPVYPHRRLRLGPDGASGQGLWSRYPIAAEELWDGSRRGERWQHAVLSVDGRRLHLVNLHLTSPALRWRTIPDVPVPVTTGEVTQARSLEVAWLLPRLRELARGPDPLIVGGDLNMTDQTPEYRRLLGAGLRDAHREAGWGFGHSFPALPTLRIASRRVPVPVPLVRIDYVLHSPRVHVSRVETWPDSGGSDHRPVVANLVLLPPTG
jgi:vancomycin resistance protein VanJ